MSVLAPLFSAPYLPFTLLTLLLLAALLLTLTLGLKHCQRLANDREEARREATRLTDLLTLEREAHALRLETVNSLRDSLESQSGKLTEAYAQQARDLSTVEHLTALKASLEEEITKRDGRIDELIAEREDLSAMNLSLKGEMRSLTALKEQVELHEARERQRLQSAFEQMQAELDESREALSHSEERYATLREQNLTLSAELDHVRTELIKEREAQTMANRSLEERLQNFSEELLKKRSSELNLSSREEFLRAVGPLKNELEQFRSLLLKTQQSSSEQSGALRAELLKLHETHVAVSAQTEELISALRGGRKSQGMWGEHQLELCLEAAGLHEGTDYLREVAGNRALNERGRPDVIVRLPHDHCLIIDAKCALTAYTLYVNATDEKSRAESMKRHLASLKSHIAELATKRYDSYQSFNSPSFVFMFVPVDGALTEALSADPALYSLAEKDGVYLVSPSTLIPALRVVAQLWVLSRQNEHIAAIAAEAESLYKKALTVSSFMERVKKNYHALGDSVDALDRSLLSGKGNLLSSMERFSTRAPHYVEVVNNTPAPASDVLIGEEPLKVLKSTAPAPAGPTSQEALPHADLDTGENAGASAVVPEDSAIPLPQEPSMDLPSLSQSGTVANAEPLPGEGAASPGMPTFPAEELPPDGTASQTQITPMSSGDAPASASLSFPPFEIVRS